MDKILDIRNLSVDFVTDDGTVHAVNDLSLSLNRGQTLGLVGETGAGKTTTAKTILRLLPKPQGRVMSGEIEFNGEDLLSIPIKDMQKVQQQYAQHAPQRNQHDHGHQLRLHPENLRLHQHENKNAQHNVNENDIKHIEPLL